MIDFDRVAREEARISRHDVAQPHANDIAGHEFSDLRIDPLPVSPNAGVDGELGLQSCNRVSGLVLFPESDDGVGAKQEENDAKIQPVANDCGQNHCPFDHPRDGSPEITEELQKRILGLLRNLVGTVLRQPFRSLSSS